MEEIKALILDDEQLVLDNLKILLKQFPNVKIVYEGNSSLKALEDYPLWKEIDVAILDINMPEPNGVEMAERIFDINPCIKIIFLTAFDEYVMEAFSVNMVDYILKPVTVRRLQRSIKKLDELLSREKNKQTLPAKATEAESAAVGENASTRIVGFKENKYFVIDAEEACFITVRGREVILVTKGGEYILKHRINDWEEKLSGQGWIRCHRAYLINMKHIRTFSPMFNSTYLVKMDGYEEEIPVSRSYSNEFKKRLGI